MTEFENPETITLVTAHYDTPTGRQGSKDFATVAEYHRWEKRVEAEGYDINCVDTTRAAPSLIISKEDMVARLRSILILYDDGRAPQMGDSDTDIARREGRDDICAMIRDLLASV